MSTWRKVCCCLFATGAAVGAWAYTPHDYAAQDHLIAQWDGIDNAGTGVHVADASTWKDLVGTRDLTVNTAAGAAFQNGNCLARLDTTTEKDSRMAYYSEAVTEAKTVEIVIKRKAYAQYAVLISCQGHTYGMLAMKNSTVGSNFGGYKTASEACDGANTTLSLCTDMGTIFANGVQCAATTVTEGWGSTMTDDFAVGGRQNSKDNPFYGSVYAVRLYDRELSPEEIAWNAFVDDFRFFGGERGTCSLTVVGDPMDYGSPNPAYGKTTGLTPGDEFVCSVPSPIEFTGGSAVCAGYLLETNAPMATDVWCAWKSGEGNSLDYVHPDLRDVRLTWLWNVDADLGALEPSVVSVSPTDAELDVTVTGLGDASSLTLRLEYGSSATTLDRSVAWPAPVTIPGTYRVALDELLPNTAYFVRAVLDTGSATYVTDVTPFVTGAIVERVLPQEYQTIEYLASSGAQFIDTGVGGGGRTRSVADMMWIGTNSDKDFLGARKDQNTRYYLLHSYSGWCMGYKNAYSAGVVSPDVRFHVETTLGPGSQTLAVNGIPTISQTVADPVETGRNLYLFAMNYGTPSAYATARCYSLKIWKDDSLVRDFVPCLRRSDNVPGLYDYVSTNFFTAGGTAFDTHFAYGRDVYAAEADDERFALTIAPSAEDSALYCVYGPSYGGEDVAAWGTCESCGTVAKDAETATADVPTGWGGSVKMLRAFLVTGTVTNWSPTVIYRDAALPQVSGVAVDGSAGDTLAVTGVLDYFPGDDCTLRVLVGDSAATLDRVWSDLPGGVRTETGDFAFTLHKDDPADPLYVCPGRTCFVAVEATSAGASARSAVVEVTPAGAAKLSAVRVTSVQRHRVNVEGQVDDLGVGGASEFALWMGETDDPETFTCVAGPVALTETGPISIFCDVPELEVTRYWQLRTVNWLADGGRTVSAATEVMTCYTKDDTTYTWKGEVTEGDWCNRANWNSSNGEDCIGYPNAETSSAVFPADAKCRVTLSGDVKVYNLTASESAVDLAISSAAGSTITVSGGFAFGGTSKSIVSSLRFSNVLIRSGKGTIGGGIALTFAGGGISILGDRVELCIPTVGKINDDIGAASLLLEDGATLTGVRSLGVAQGGVLTVRNGTVDAQRILFNWLSGGGLLRIEGANSVVKASEAIRNAWDAGYDAITNGFGGIVFAPPAGGYAVPPLQGHVNLGLGADTKMNIYADPSYGALHGGAKLDLQLTDVSGVVADKLNVHPFPEPYAAKSFFYWTKDGTSYERVQPDDTGTKAALYGHFNVLNRGIILIFK